MTNNDYKAAYEATSKLLELAKIENAKLIKKNEHLTRALNRQSQPVKYQVSVADDV